MKNFSILSVTSPSQLLLWALPGAIVGRWGAVRLEWKQGAHNYDFGSLFLDGYFQMCSLPPSGAGDLFFILSILGSLGILQGNGHIPPRESPGVLLTRLFENFSFTYTIFAWALELVTNTMESSLSTLGMSSQNVASPVACLRPDKCIMGRPTGSWGGWRESTVYRGRQESPWKTIIFRSSLANYQHSWFRIEKCDSHPWAPNTGVGQMMRVAT